MWFELLQPYEAELNQSLLCGEATEPANTTPSNAFQAWGPDRFWDTPTKIRGPYVGSYAFNSWLYHPVAPPPTARRWRSRCGCRRSRPPASRRPLTPARFDMPPDDKDPPRLDNTPGATGGMRRRRLERHKDGVNVLFLDGHAEHVPAPGLWDLKWSETFQPRRVTIER